MAARIKLRVVTNGAGSPPAKVIITIRGPKGKVLRQVTRQYKGPNTNYFFKNLPPRRLSFSFIIIPKNGQRFHDTTSRTVIKVTPLKKKKR